MTGDRTKGYSQPLTRQHSTWKKAKQSSISWNDKKRKQSQPKKTRRESRRPALQKEFPLDFQTWAIRLLLKNITRLQTWKDKSSLLAMRWMWRCWQTSQTRGSPSRRQTWLMEAEVGSPRLLPYKNRWDSHSSIRISKSKKWKRWTFSVRRYPIPT